MFNLPESTEYTRRISKRKIGKHYNMEDSVKREFDRKIKRIYWRNRLSPETLGLSSGRDVDEFEVFEIVLSDTRFDVSLLDYIGGLTSNPIVYALKYNDDVKVCVNGECTDWVKEDDIDFSLIGMNIGAIYDNFIIGLEGLKNQTPNPGEVPQIEGPVRTVDVKGVEVTLEDLFGDGLIDTDDVMENIIELTGSCTEDELQQILMTYGGMYSEIYFNNRNQLDGDIFISSNGNKYELNRDDVDEVYQRITELEGDDVIIKELTMICLYLYYLADKENESMVGDMEDEVVYQLDVPKERIITIEGEDFDIQAIFGREGLDYDTLKVNIEAEFFSDTDRIFREVVEKYSAIYSIYYFQNLGVLDSDYNFKGEVNLRKVSEQPCSVEDAVASCSRIIDMSEYEMVFIIISYLRDECSFKLSRSAIYNEDCYRVVEVNGYRFNMSNLFGSGVLSKDIFDDNYNNLSRKYDLRESGDKLFNRLSDRYAIHYFVSRGFIDNDLEEYYSFKGKTYNILDLIETKKGIDNAINKINYDYMVNFGKTELNSIESRMLKLVFRKILNKYYVDNKFNVCSYCGSKFIKEVKSETERAALLSVIGGDKSFSKARKGRGQLMCCNCLHEI